MNEIQTTRDMIAPPLPSSLTEDQLSDLLWLVDNYGHKLVEAVDYVTPEEVACTARTLEALMDGMG